MAQQFLPRFNPPKFIESSEPNLYKRFEGFLRYWNTYNQYVINHVGRLQGIIQTLTAGSATPFKTIAAAATIRPLQQVQPISGGAKITQIETPEDFTNLTLLSLNGFSLGGGGNIATTRTTIPGEGLSLVKNLKDGLWYTITVGERPAMTVPVFFSEEDNQSDEIIPGPQGPKGDQGLPGPAIPGFALADDEGESGEPLSGIPSPPRSAPYSVSNVTPDRSYDANLTSLNELADVLGTLIADLQEHRLLG